MRRLLLAGLFMFSLTLVSGCGGDASGPATKGDTPAGDTAGISGMQGSGGDDKKGGNQLPPPPPLKVPPGAQ